jgi:hypothetical protein
VNTAVIPRSSIAGRLFGKLAKVALSNASPVSAASEPQWSKPWLVLEFTTIGWYGVNPNFWINCFALRVVLVYWKSGCWPSARGQC